MKINTSKQGPMVLELAVSKLALVNNLWLGDVPLELSMLTLLEQMLVSQHFPQCYVVKLYPWDGCGFNPRHLQQGLLGNVTLYNMNMDAIIDMLKGQLLPHPAIQLVSVLAVTFVGSKKLPKSWLKKLCKKWKSGKSRKTRFQVGE